MYEKFLRMTVKRDFKEGRRHFGRTPASICQLKKWCSDALALWLSSATLWGKSNLFDLNLSFLFQQRQIEATLFTSSTNRRLSYLLMELGWHNKKEYCFNLMMSQEKRDFQLTTNVCMSNKMSTLFYGKLWQTYFSSHLCLKMIHDQLDKACCHKYTECLLTL